MTDAFDPRAHRLTIERGFEGLEIGELFRLPSRTIGDGNFTAFQAVSLDNHPIHYDHEYCARLGHPAPLAHGLQVLSFTAAGAGLFPHVVGEALIGFIEVSAKFLKAVYPGDTLYPALEIVAKTPQRTTGIIAMRATVHNQHGELVLEGEHKYLLRLAGSTAD
ncbi:MAG: MaoC family dehydratase [Candidatus Sphingomonas colombiensis]|nr:MaoC family dehydratase [Sphingomonas sp.]WEK43494.1 MAG: MaoC family dehydratase [Sphingomonas sp.]